MVMTIFYFFLVTCINQKLNNRKGVYWKADQKPDGKDPKKIVIEDRRCEDLADSKIAGLDTLFELRACSLLFCFSFFFFSSSGNGLSKSEIGS